MTFHLVLLVALLAATAWTWTHTTELARRLDLIVEEARAWIRR